MFLGAPIARSALKPKESISDPHADGLGSVTSLANGSGTLTQTYTYDSFGKVTASSGSLINPFLYTAREADAEAGLYYYRARYYDQSAGRFISKDPVRFFQSPDFYQYVSNNSLNLSDATGLQAKKPNLPPGTPDKYARPLADAFAIALNLLNSTRCAQLYEPSCHPGLGTVGANQMRATEYRFLDLPVGDAQTADSTHAHINDLGTFITAQSGVIRLPDRSTYDLGSIANVQAFILLHELGHQLKYNTGFPDDVNAATNSSNSLRVIKSCFR